MLTIPKFENETGEANWLYKNREGLGGGVSAGGAGGPGAHRTLKQRGITPPTTIRLAPEDISLARTLAGRSGLRRQTNLKVLIHGALEWEERWASY